MTTVAVTREAIEEKPDVIFEAMQRLARLADHRNPAPVIIEKCPGHEDQVMTLASGKVERCFIHLSQEAWHR